MAANTEAMLEEIARLHGLQDASELRDEDLGAIALQPVSEIPVGTSDERISEVTAKHCLYRVNSAQSRQSRPNSGLGFEVNVLETFQVDSMACKTLHSWTVEPLRCKLHRSSPPYRSSPMMAFPRSLRTPIAVERIWHN